MKFDLPIFALSTLALSLCGCSDNQHFQKSEAADDSTVFVALTNRSITVNVVSNRILILDKIKAAQGRKIKDKRFPYWANITAMKIIPALVAAARFDLKFDDEHFQRTDASDALVLAKYNRMLKNDYPDADSLIASFGSLAPEFKRQFVHESRMEAFYATKPALAVTQKDIDGYYNNFSNRLAMATQANSNVLARASEAYAKLKAGANWDELAPQMTDEGKSEDDAASANNWREWEDISPKDFYLPSVAEAVITMKPGEISMPIETSDGIVIVKFIKKTEDNRYRCARILFYQAIVPEEIPQKNLQAYLKQKKRYQCQFSVLAELRELYPAQYPLGTNFTYKIWKEPRPLRKGFNLMPKD